MRTNLKYTLILFFLICHNFFSFAQIDSSNLYSYSRTISPDMDITLLKKNKVSAIVKFSVNKTSGKKDTLEIYYLDDSFNAYKKVYKNILSHNSQWMAKELSTNADKSMNTYNDGDYKDDSISRIHFRQTIHFNKLKQIIKITEDDFTANPNHTITIHEPKPGSAENNYKRTILHLNNADTILIMSYMKTPKLFTYVLQDKPNGKWTVKENDSITLANGKPDTFKSYVNGKLVNSTISTDLRTKEKPLEAFHSKDDKNKDTDEFMLNGHHMEKISIVFTDNISKRNSTDLRTKEKPIEAFHSKDDKNKDTDEFMLNGHHMEKISIVFTDNISKRNYQEMKNMNRSKKDFKVVKHYNNGPGEKEKIYWVDIYYPNELIHSRDLTNERSYTLFEYK